MPPTPLPVAVTGHRDPDPPSLPGLRRRLDRVLGALQTAHPSTPLLLLSALAEGADRLAVEVALERGIEVVAVLPMPEALYVADFPDTVEDFAALKARCANVVVLPVPSAEDASRPGAARDRCYQRLGRWLAREALILLALWDGTEAGGPGGTADVVGLELSGRHGSEEQGLQHDPVSGTVCHILTPREGAPTPSGAPLRWLGQRDREPLVLAGDPLPQGGVFPMLARLDELNQEQRAASIQGAGDVLRAATWFVPEADQPGLSRGQLALLRRYALADTAALRYQRRRHRTLGLLSLIACVSVSALEVYKEGLGTQPWALGVLALYPLGLALGWARYRWARAQGHETRQIDYRALAEGLRIQLVWALCGLPDDVTDSYLRTHEGEFQWVRGALRASVLQSRLTSDDLRTGPPTFRLVQRIWVREQRRYFARSAQDKADRARRHHRIIQGMFWLSVAASLGLGPARVIWGQATLFGSLQIGGAFELTAAIALATAAALSGFSDRLHLPELSRQHDRMHRVFARADDRIEDLLDRGDHEGARTILRELGQAALHENSAWVLLHRARPLEAPGAGP